jgi:hypothetical protein
MKLFRAENFSIQYLLVAIFEADAIRVKNKASVEDIDQFICFVIEFVA